MVLEPIGDIADVALTESSGTTEILTFETESDWHDAHDRPAMVTDGIGDHAGAAKVASGYYIGSLTRGLAGYWPFDEGSGSTAGDETELGNDGTINGASWNGSGQVGGESLSFDGTDDNVDLGTPRTESPLTVSAWINPSNWTGNRFNYVVGYEQGSSPYIGYVIRDDDNATSGSEFQIRIKDGSGTAIEVSGSRPSTGSWTHVALTYSSDGTLTGYKGGSSFGTASGDGSITQVSTNVWVGDSPGFSTNRVFDGSIDDVRVYGRVLSQPEIDALASLTATSAVNAGDTL